MAEILSKIFHKKEPQYPSVLDVVSWNGEEYQIAGMVQKKKGGMFILKDLKTNETFRIKGAKFIPGITEEPKDIENVYRADEGVRVTGALKGGKKTE